MLSDRFRLLLVKPSQLGPRILTIDSTVSRAQYNFILETASTSTLTANVPKLVDALESTRNLDLGLGAPVGYSRSDHQALHKVWGTELDQTGKYQAIDLE